MTEKKVAREFWIERSGLADLHRVHLAPRDGFIHVREVLDEPNYKILYISANEYLEELEKDNIKLQSQLAKAETDYEVLHRNKVDQLAAKQAELDKAIDAFNFANEHRVRAEKESEAKDALILELVGALENARDTLSFVQYRAPGYDWNADPLYLTLKTGNVFQQIEMIIPRARAAMKGDGK